MQFSEIPGLEEIKKRLIRSFERGKVAHAQLYTGDPCTSAFPLALSYATYLMCQNKGVEDSCGTCANCVRMKKSIHPDVHWYFPKIAASDSGKYDKVLAEALPLWRTFISETPFGSLVDWTNKYGQENKNLQLSREDSHRILKDVSMRSVEGGYKLIFIWGAEFMHPAGANAILKILEEPPENTVYLVVSNNHDSLPQTIVSRTQRVTVPPHSAEEIQAYLVEHKRADPSQAQQLSKIAQGKIGMAIRLLEQDEHLAHSAFRDWMLACWNRDFTSLVRSSEDFSKTDKPNQRSFLTYSMAFIRNAVLKTVGNEAPTNSAEEDQFVERYAQRLGRQKLEVMYALINEALQHLQRNANPRIAHLNLSLAIVRSFAKGREKP